MSDTSAELQEACRQLVAREVYYCVWGRSTTGQAIYIDDVIVKIYHELHRKEAA
jgi:hypothetical protein